MRDHLSSPKFIHTLSRSLWTHAAHGIALVVLLYCITQTFDPPRLNWGDQNSDYNIMTSGENFARVGFVALRFTPVVLSPHYHPGGEPPQFYTHYPPLPDLANGLWRVLGMTELYEFRWMALAFSFGALFFFHPLVRHYWSKPVADLSLVLWVVNPLWLQHVDYLHHYPYCWFFGFGCLYWLHRYFQRGQKRYVAFSSLFLFLAYMSSYDYWFFVPLLVALMTWRHVGTIGSRRYWGIVSLIGAGAVLALVAKLGLAAWALGGWDAALNDVIYQFHERSTDRITHTGFQAGALITIVLRIYRFYTPVFGPVLLFAILFPSLNRLLFRKHGIDSTIYRNNPAVLFLVALPFVFCFMELFVGQYYPALQLLPAYTASSACFIVWLFQFRRRITRVAAIACLALILAHVGLEMTVLKKAFISYQTIASLRKELDAATPAGRMVLTNHDFGGLYRYYFDRKIDGVILQTPDVFIRVLVRNTDGPVIFVEHKNIEAQLFDKTHYIIFARFAKWEWFGDPVKYRNIIAQAINLQNEQLMEAVAKVGRRISDHEEYALWLIPQYEPLPPPKLLHPDTGR
jgi:hypothetical protein